jgi:phospholipid/cholesterol/gamma-HCH transport system permease protein
MKDSESLQNETPKEFVPARLLGALGNAVLTRGQSFFSRLGGASLLLGRSANLTVKGLFVPSARIRGQTLAIQMVRLGVKAIPIVILIQMAIGMIMPLQMFPKLDEFGQADQVATINAIAAFRELGPLMTAIVLSGFAGASIAAELGTMVTSEEIEALEVMALNPVRFLVLPRLLATIMMTVMLSIIADVVMVGSGMLTGMGLGLDSDTYYQMTLDAVDLTGFATGLIKAGIYGLLIGLISCFLGLSVKPWEGSEGVGNATTKTVVYSIVAVIIAAAIFTMIFYSYGLFD